MIKYDRGDTFYRPVTHQTYSAATDTWTTADPDVGFPKITITDPDGSVKVDNIKMDPVATGIFEYRYEIPSDAVTGKWVVTYKWENNEYPDQTTINFMVQ